MLIDTSIYDKHMDLRFDVRANNHGAKSKIHNKTKQLEMLINNLRISEYTDYQISTSTGLASSWMQQFVTPDYVYLENNKQNHLTIQKLLRKKKKKKNNTDSLNIRKDSPLISENTKNF